MRGSEEFEDAIKEQLVSVRRGKVKALLAKAEKVARVDELEMLPLDSGITAGAVKYRLAQLRSEE